MPVSRDTGERAIKLFGHSTLGWGAHIRKFLQRPEAAAMRLVCTKLRETVDGRWTFPRVRGSSWGLFLWRRTDVSLYEEQVGVQSVL